MNNSRRILTTAVGLAAGLAAFLATRAAVRHFMSPSPSEVQAPKEWKLKEKDGDRVSRFLREGMKPLLSHPKFLEKVAAMQARGASPAEAEAFGHSLTAKGFPRLSPEELLEWNRLRIALAKESPRLCAGLWTGAIRPEDLGASMASLSDSDLRAWTRLSMKAGVAELEQSGAPLQASPAQIGTMMESILTRVSGQAKADLETALATTKPNDKIACSALMSVLVETQKLEGTARETALRILASLNSG